jgi:hypothetical protein
MPAFGDALDNAGIPRWNPSESSSGGASPPNMSSTQDLGKTSPDMGKTMPGGGLLYAPERYGPSNPGRNQTTVGFGGIGRNRLTITLPPES